MIVLMMQWIQSRSFLIVMNEESDADIDKESGELEDAEFLDSVEEQQEEWKVLGFEHSSFVQVIKPVASFGKHIQ